jgi:hypothetical protein
MKITLKRPIALGFGLMGDQLDLKAGEHIIDDAWASDTFVKSLIASGDIVMGGDVPVAPNQLSYGQGPIRMPESGSIKNIEQPKKVGTLKYDMDKVVFTESGPKKVDIPVDATLVDDDAESGIDDAALDSEIKDDEEKIAVLQEDVEKKTVLKKRSKKKES